MRFGEPHAQFDAVVLHKNLKRLDLARRRNDALGEAEAERKILEILRRRHHHRIGRAVEGEGHRGFFRNGPFARREPRAAPAMPFDLAGWVEHRFYSAASTGAMRRLSRAKSA